MKEIELHVVHSGDKQREGMLHCRAVRELQRRMVIVKDRTGRCQKYNTVTYNVF